VPANARSAPGSHLLENVPGRHNPAIVGQSDASLLHWISAWGGIAKRQYRRRSESDFREIRQIFQELSVRVSVEAGEGFFSKANDSPRSTKPKEIMLTKSLQLSIITLLVSAVAAWASTPSGPARIQGVVRDSSLKPIAGAEVHITAKDGSGLLKVVRTDSGGQYGVSKLPVTDYEVVLFVNGQIKASINNTKVFPDKPTQLDFKLTGKFAAAGPQKKHTHMVYVPAETGSNLSGHWVEVDDNAGAAAAQSGEVSRLSGDAVRRMQAGGSNSGHE